MEKKNKKEKPIAGEHIKQNPMQEAGHLTREVNKTQK
jgi:hypothetical protein